MLWSPRKNGLGSLFKEVMVVKVIPTTSLGEWNASALHRTSVPEVFPFAWSKGGQTCTFRTCTLFFVISLHCLTLLGARDCPCSFTQCGSNREEGGERRHGMEVKAKILAENKCTFERCTFVPSWLKAHIALVAPHCRATLCHIAFSRIWRGVARTALHPLKGPCSTHGVAPQVRCRSYTVTCRGCDSGPLSWGNSGDLGTFRRVQWSFAWHLILMPFIQIVLKFIVEMIQN